MATDITGSLTQLPNLKMPVITPGFINLVVIASICALVVFILFKLRQNRIYVDIYEKVKGGYVSKPGRYRLIYDKTTKMHTLTSMMGKTRLAPFMSE